MHLRSITMKGFKSFPERTKLDFAPGVSVIVGPNGCGKSNITDAVLWALGEQSPLAVRGQSMQDVIFAGGQGQSRRRAAEVEVVIDNSDGVAPSEFSEISVKRRLDRSGDGGYWLNGARARLADVVEALADTNLGREMHSVISQGRVEEIVHSKPRHRRMLVEEAAGLGKHRKRRRRAQLKLERTQDNLDRALDVEREARLRLRPLKRQAQAAEIHARLEREGMELRARLLAEELRSHDEVLSGRESDATKARETRDAIEAKLAEVNKERSAIEERLAERDRERTLVWGRLTAIRAAHERLTVRAEALASRRAELAAGIDRRKLALGQLAAEAAASGSEAEQLEAELRAIGDALAQSSGALERAVADAEADARARELARVREGSERAARGARRAEGLLGRGRQDSLERRVESEGALLEALGELVDAAAGTRDALGLPRCRRWSATCSAASRPRTTSPSSSAPARAAMPSSRPRCGWPPRRSRRPRSAPPRNAIAAPRPQPSSAGSRSGWARSQGPRPRRSARRSARRSSASSSACSAAASSSAR